MGVVPGNSASTWGSRDRLEIEFGTYSEWLIEAMLNLDPADTIGPACRGTARPDLFAILADALGLETDTSVLDVGSGFGGPAAWLMRERGARVVGVDLMEAEVAASVRFFPGLSGVVGSAGRLPLRDAAFDAVWSLGVFEMLANKSRAVAEAARVLKSGGRFAVYGFFANDAIRDCPGANRFESPSAFVGRLTAAGLSVVDVVRGQKWSTPAAWRASIEMVRDEVRRLHAGDPRLVLVESELGSFNWLRMTDQISDWIVIAEKPSS